MKIIVPWFDFLQEKHRCLTSWAGVRCSLSLLLLRFNLNRFQQCSKLLNTTDVLYSSVSVCTNTWHWWIIPALYSTLFFLCDSKLVYRQILFDFSLSVVCFNYILKKELKFSSLIMRNSTKFTFQSQVIEKWFLLSASICNCTSCDSTRMHKSQLNLEKLCPKRHLAYQKRDKWLTY